MAARNNPAKAGKQGAQAAGGAQDGIHENGSPLDAAAEAAQAIAQAARSGEPLAATEEAKSEGEAALPPTPPVIIGGVPTHALKEIDKATPARTGARAAGEQHLTASATCSQRCSGRPY